MGWGQGEAEEERGGCEIPHQEGSRLEGSKRNASILAFLFWEPAPISSSRRGWSDPLASSLPLPPAPPLLRISCFPQIRTQEINLVSLVSFMLSLHLSLSLAIIK